MSEARMDKNLLKYMAFVKTVEYGGFTKASEILNYSQSGISRMINDLETEWKVTLLERSKTGVKLTSDGLKLLPHAKAVVGEYEKLQMEVDALNGLQSGIIRISTMHCSWVTIQKLKNGFTPAELISAFCDCLHYRNLKPIF